MRPISEMIASGEGEQEATGKRDARESDGRKESETPETPRRDRSFDWRGRPRDKDSETPRDR